ncbi:MAG: helix-turn-helix domain-containing protein [Pseudomonadota bacterium]
MARGDQVARILRICKIIEKARFGVSLEDIHQKIILDFKVSLRTLRRDIEAIEKAGVPIYSEKVDGKTRWYCNGKM